MKIPFLEREAQSWTEYLIIIAVIIVIGLVLLGIFGVLSGAESAGAPIGGH
ncbi:MAG: hypothetical protein ABIF92_03060 [archaeon]